MSMIPSKTLKRKLAMENPSQHRPQCAACKRMRRECTPQCELAPYLPPSSSHQAELLSRLFGLPKVEKTLKQFDRPEEKAEAMKNMVLESRLRAADPVGGSGRVITRLRGRIRDLERQLEHNRQQHMLFLYHCIAGFPYSRPNPHYGYPIPVQVRPAAAALQPPLPLQNPNVWGHQEQNPNVMSIHDYDVHSEVESNDL